MGIPSKLRLFLSPHFRPIPTIVVMAVTALLLTACSEKQAAGPPPPPDVGVSQVEQRDVPVYGEWVARRPHA